MSQFKYGTSSLGRLVHSVKSKRNALFNTYGFVEEVLLVNLIFMMNDDSI